MQLDQKYTLQRIEIGGGGPFSELNTAAGIHVGSTEAEVLSAYPDGKFEPGPEYTMRPDHRIDGQLGSLTLFVEDGRVTGIKVTTKEMLPYGDICD